MTVQELERGVEQVWITKLIREWYIQELELHKRMGKERVLRIPNFSIGKKMTRWGVWNLHLRTIEISAKLLRNYDWNAVVHVLKHEMAHQLVDEYLKFQGDPHGEAFILACKFMEVDPARCIGSEALSGIGGGDEGIVLKIKKLLAKGSNEAVSQAEGEAFLQKAQELMVRYNIEIADLADSGQFFVQRPVTPVVSRWPDFFYTLGHLMKEFYNVQYIRYCTYDGAYLEYFGEPSNVDVAEYVSHVIIQQGESLYQEFLKEHAARRARGEYVRKASRSAFMNGLINGYGKKLKAQRESVIAKVQEQFRQERVFVPVEEPKIDKDCTGILLASSKILREHFERQYNPRNGQRVGCRGDGYIDGRLASASLNINPGIRATGSPALMLT